MLAAVAMALVTAGLLAQDPPPTVTCRACGNEGALDCSKHGKVLLPQEQAVQFCSVAAECKACGGVLRVDCKVCRNGPVEDELARRLKLVQEWREQRRTGVDELHKGQALLHVKTAHLDLAYGIRPLTVGKEKLDTHAGMHLYGERIEALRAQFLLLLGADEKDLSARLQVYMCRDEQAHVTLAPRFTGGGGNGSSGSKLMGSDSVYCMWHDLRAMPDDEALHRTVVHNVTHLLLSNLAPAVWLGNRGHGWVDEGLAHWFEDKVTGKCTNFCFEELLLQPGAGWKGGRWRAPVRRMLDEGKLESFAELSTRNTDQLSFPEHAQSFACIDYLLSVFGGPRLHDFVKAIKSKVPTRDALKSVYGTNPLTFDTEFQAWVKANYSPLDPPR